MSTTDNDSLYVTNRRTGAVDEHKGVSPTLLAFMGTGGGNIPILGGQHPHAAVGEGVSPTLTAASGGGGGHTPVIASELSVRRLTPEECEALQGFPRGWTEINSTTNRYKEMGNAVAVPVVNWIIEGIVKVYNERK